MLKSSRDGASSQRLGVWAATQQPLRADRPVGKRARCRDGFAASCTVKIRCHACPIGEGLRVVFEIHLASVH